MTLGLLLLLDMTRVVVLLLPCLRKDLSSAHLLPFQESQVAFQVESQVAFQVECLLEFLLEDYLLEFLLEDYLLVLRLSPLQASLNKTSLQVHP